MKLRQSERNPEVPALVDIEIEWDIAIMDKTCEVGKKSVSNCNSVTRGQRREQAMRIRWWFPLVLQITENDEDPSLLTSFPTDVRPVGLFGIVNIIPKKYSIFFEENLVPGV